MMSSKFIFIPKNLNLEAIIEEYPPKIKSFSHDKLKWIVHLIPYLLAYSQKVKKYAKENNGFVPLSAVKLKMQLGNDYAKYVRYLIDRKIIECDNHYIVGKKTRSYRLCKKYRKPLRMEVNKRKKGISAKRFAELHKLKKEYRFLKWFDKNLVIDKAEADKFVDSIYNPNDGYTSYCCSFVSCEELYYKEFHYIVDDTSKRLHTNISNLPKVLKPFVSYGGSQLVGLDVTNAQPYFLSTIFKTEFYYKKGEFKLVNIMDYETKSQGIIAIKQWLIMGGVVNSLILLKNLKEPDIQNINKYISLVSSGTLYEKYCDEYNTMCGTAIDRDIAKKRLIRMLYSQYHHYVPERRVFIQMFPVVHRVLDALSGNYYKSKAVLLQRIESFLMIEKVCKRISKERPDLPIFTIHDNIVTTIGNEEYVEQVIKSVLKEYIGYEPKVGIELWE